MMGTAKKHHFQILNVRTVVIDQECTFEEIRRLGDTLATSQRQRLQVQAFNEPLGKWDKLGSFLGNMSFLNWDGLLWIINDDFKGMHRASRKEVDAE